MKAITMTKKGVGTVKLVLTDGEVYISAREIRHPDKDVLNGVYRNFKDDGYVIKPEKAVAAPAKPETETQKPAKQVTKKLHWEFPEEFDRVKYIETARNIDPKAVYVTPYGLKVRREFREATYIAMGGKRVER